MDEKSVIEFSFKKSHIKKRKIIENYKSTNADKLKKLLNLQGIRGCSQFDHINAAFWQKQEIFTKVSTAIIL